MFDSDGRIVVSNQRLSRLMGLLPNCELKGLSLHCLLESGVEAGLISDVNAQSVIERMDARLSGSGDAALVVDMQNGRVLEFTLQHMDNVVPARQVICREQDLHDVVPVICEGWAASVIILSDQRRQILSILLPGDMVSTALLFDAPAECLVEAINRRSLPHFQAGRIEGKPVQAS